VCVGAALNAVALLTVTDTSPSELELVKRDDGVSIRRAGFSADRLTSSPPFYNWITSYIVIKDVNMFDHISFGVIAQVRRAP
jgi:hypothetical protein